MFGSIRKDPQIHPDLEVVLRMMSELSFLPENCGSNEAVAYRHLSGSKGEFPWGYPPEGYAAEEVRGLWYPGQVSYRFTKDGYTLTYHSYHDFFSATTPSRPFRHYEIILAFRAQAKKAERGLSRADTPKGISGVSLSLTESKP